MALTLLWLVVALAFVAFFTGMEVASGYADRLRLEVGRKSGVASRILSLFFRYSHDLASTLLVGNCIALIAYGVLVAYLAYAYFLPEVAGVDVWVLGGVSVLAAGAAMLALGFVNAAGPAILLMLALPLLLRVPACLLERFQNDLVDELGEGERRAELLSAFNMSGSFLEVVFLVGSAALAAAGAAFCFGAVGLLLAALSLAARRALD